MKYIRLLLSLSSVSFMACCIEAQSTFWTTPGGFPPPQVEPGAPSTAYALSGFDSINYFNGKMNFRLPVLKIGGRGDAGYTMTLPIENEWALQNAAWFPSV